MLRSRPLGSLLTREGEFICVRANNLSADRSQVALTRMTDTVFVREPEGPRRIAPELYGHFAEHLGIINHIMLYKIPEPTLYLG